MTDGFNLGRIKTSPLGDYDPEELAKATDHAKRYAQIAEIIYNWQDPDNGRRLFGQQIFGFCATIKQSVNAAAFFNSYFNRLLPKGMRFAAAMHSGLTDSEKIDIDQAYRDGKILMLTTPKYLVEGYDHRPASVAFNIVPTCSPVRAIQRGGRIMRMDEAIPDKISYVFDVLDQGRLDNSVLYCEAVGGTRFFRNDEMPVPNPEHAALLRAISAYWNASLNGPRVIEPEKLVLKFARPAFQKAAQLKKEKSPVINGLASVPEKKQTSEEEKRYPIINDKILPSLRQRMEELDYVSIREIFNHWASMMPETKVTYHDLLKLARGLSSVKEDTFLTEEAEIFIEILDDDIEKIFMSHTEFSGHRDSECDENNRLPVPSNYLNHSDFNINFSLYKIGRCLVQTGLTDIKELISIFQSEYNLPKYADFTLVNLISGRYSVINLDRLNSPTRIEPLALLLCDFFGRELTDLFSEDQYFKLLDKLPNEEFRYPHIQEPFRLAVVETHDHHHSRNSIPLPSKHKRYNVLPSDKVKFALAIMPVREGMYQTNRDLVGGPQNPPRWVNSSSQEPA